ncbi:hypothetical protein LTS08_003669 [Lithohypha guttulata]|uniref:uncharacterized protein n=1 Tax=Lithohypha guttulata TaxID=1690604 RepID=UPI002DDF3C88|nr:hypothetical protein LTR51_001375 [Lithohypha guttulata]KAK5102867.1 hypothetical protein LTS08_003669 [Lithohypha guttulata]
MTDNSETSITAATTAASIHSDSTSTLSRRSSSQASRASADSKRLKTIRGPKRGASRAVLKSQSSQDASLTSFPSLSPEPDENVPPANQDLDKPTRTTSQRVRARKATLAGLTKPSLLNTSNALFDDSPRSSLDIPGSLHLTNDEHIERLLKRVGAVKLIRQYAQDLAQRDAEMSALRVRADERERELKRLLREADVSSAEVEKRLLRLETPNISTSTVGGSDSGPKRTSSVSIDSMINDAIVDVHDSSSVKQSPQLVAATGLPSPPAAMMRRLKSSASVSQLQNENVMSRNSSRTNSIVSGDDGDRESTLRPRQPSSAISRVTGLQSIFQPPSTTTSYFIGGGSKKISTKPKAGDEMSVKSTQSGKSATSWTRIFGTRNQSGRSRASSIDQANAPPNDSLTNAHTKIRGTAARGNPGPTASSGRPQPQRSATLSRINQSQTHVRKDSNASSLPPTVELDAMIESSQLPPTMSNYNTEGVLVDRFGFIYDRKRKRQHVQAQRHQKYKSSATASLKSFHSGDGPATTEHANRPVTPASIDDDSPKKSWQDYLLPSTASNMRRPKELLAHTPSAGAVVTVSTAGAEGTITPPRMKDTSVSVSATSQKALPSGAKTSAITAVSTGQTQDIEDEASEIGAAKALLDQLTEVHDNLQAERTVKWNDFLRRVRAERSTATTDKPSKNAPEADLVNGELIGIASLGRSSKTKAKYMHFKSLVLAGIPVSLRPKIWAECSGASSLRVPGYYEDLVARSNDDSEMEADILQQIQADVKRTLKDNVFFRDASAPGAQRLEELLRAYSLHNPRIGYCQGMNLITASLLLICATPEDCFWLLVAIIDYILPSGYFDQNLLVARADQIVLREYVAEVLPKLDAKLQELGVELEACTFHWFLSLYTGVLTGGEALYRAWDVTLCLNSSDSAPIALQQRSAAATLGVEGYLNAVQPSTPTTPSTLTASTDDSKSGGDHDGTCSPFLFQLSLALLKLNEEAITALDSPAQVYTYLNHNMTAHNITIDALINASEMLRSRVKRTDVLDRRKKAVESLR